MWVLFYAYDCIRYSKSFLKNGFYDMAVINLSMACEHFIKKYVLSKGIKVQDLDCLDGKKYKGYVDKFYNAGLKIIKGISLKEYYDELYGSIIELTDIRDKIAHGGSMLSMERFLDFNSEEIYEYIDDLIIDAEKVISWVKSETIRD